MKYELDARRLFCPMPVIRTQDRVASLTEGDLLEVTCTDPGVKNDIPAWCRINGHEVVSIEESRGEIVVTVKVGKG
ncbi:MAG: sulfurtransferase TusA family protein [Gammaproteobacteria bacterium]|nr:sulfurtransferase TusA family protein [Gammaproteobacteria bacterium]